MYAHARVCICSVHVLCILCMYVYACARALLCVVCMYMCVCARACARVCMCMFVCVCLYVYVCMCPPMSPLISNSMICVQTIELVKQILLLFEGNEISCSCVILNCGVYKTCKHYVRRHMHAHQPMGCLLC